MTELAQAYIHLKPYDVTQRSAKSLGRYAERMAVKAARDVYGGGVTIDIELEEGSLITRMTVFGALLGTYGVVADYKGFKESLGEIVKDAREFATFVSEPFVRKAGVDKDNVYRIERRSKTPGKLYRINKRLDRLEKSVHELSPNAIRRELADLRAELENALADVSAEEQAVVKSELTSNRNLPPLNKWPERPEQMRVARPPVEQQVSFLKDEELPDEQKKRVVFKSRKDVPEKTNRSARTKKATAQIQLLPTPD